MMSSLSENEDEQYQFFDALDDLDAASLPDSSSYCNDSSTSSSGFDNYASGYFPYHVWTGTPGSVKERRKKFLNWMGLSSDMLSGGNSVDFFEGGVDRIRESSGAVLRTLRFEDEFCSSRSSMSYGVNEQDESGLREKFEGRIGNLDGGAECDIDEMREGSKVREFQEVKLDRLVTINECQSISDSLVSSSVQQVMRSEIEEPSSPMSAAKSLKKRWLSRLRSISCISDRQEGFHNLTANGTDPTQGGRIQRVKVHQCKKQKKELSALYKGQDIQAHEGSILAMKFSLDGKYLASAGEDGIVRIWQVVEDERSNDHDIPEIDPTCMYFTVNHLSELTPLFTDKEKLSKLKSLKKTSDPACVIFPPKVFRILEKPLHEFHGHSGEILDLSWSNNNHLLSSSIDKTVRLWQVGCNHCLKIFSHNNYVTSVQFNPVDDNYFISGSIDGKVRIWAIPGCQVVDWTDIREIVTAVCYRPDGQGGIVGSMTGMCRFYNVSDNHLQLDSQTCLHGKKKSLGKRITGFQFSPQDPSMVMVTCADSQVRVLRGTNVIGKYKGLRNTGNQMSASFTSDGKHIVSACNDSNVYVWNCSSEGEPALPQAKSIRAFEHFPINASVAIPWCGMKYGNPGNGWQFHAVNESSPNTFPFPSPASFSLSQEFLLESFAKGSATWPEEKLPPSSLVSVPSAIRKSEHKFLKASCQSTYSSHAWGLVIVTAGWDGRIRSFLNYGLPAPL